MTVFDEVKTTSPNGIGFGVSAQLAAVEGAVTDAEAEIRKGVDGVIGRMKALSDGSFLMSVIQEGLGGTEFNADSLFSRAAIAGDNDGDILSLAAGADNTDYFEDSVGYEGEGK